MFSLLLQMSEAARGVGEERKQTERHKPFQKFPIHYQKTNITIHKQQHIVATHVLGTTSA